MIEKSEKYAVYFQNWRLNKSEKEEAILKTVFEIANYMASNPNLKQMAEDLQDSHSELYKKLDQYGKRNYGIVAYVKLSVDMYLENLQEEQLNERELLNNVSRDLESLFINATSETQKKLNNLLFNSNLWLSQCTNNRNNPAEVQTLCFTIYLFLKLFNLTLKGLDSFKRSLAGSLVNLPPLEASLQALLEHTENQLKKLEKNSSSPEPSTVFQYLIGCCRRVLSAPEHHGNTISEKIEKLHSALTQMAFVILKIKQNQLLSVQLRVAKVLLEAFRWNEQQITGRLYFLEFVDAHRDMFSCFLQGLDGETKAALMQNIDILKNPDKYQQLSSSVRYLASYVFALPTTAFRLTTPKDWQDKMSSISPATWDSQCKAHFREIAEKNIQTTNEQMSSSLEEVKYLTQALFPGQVEVEAMLMQLSTEECDNLAASLNEMRKGLEHFKQLSQIAVQKQAQLKEMMALKIGIEEFLAVHNQFWVVICKLLSLLFACFMTESVKLVDEAKALRKQLEQFMSQTEHSCKQALTGFNSQLPQTLYDDMLDELQKTVNNKTVPANLMIKEKNVHEAFSTISQRFFKLQKDIELYELQEDKQVYVH
ncbi:hypothetical protein [Legionella jordanis]|uniref:Purine NTPase n=1 Tax=Legionella jordanis TaxID=456 RepID=A0A0W0VBL6_9GAMM|nr:hypothetical protein [Legionella jordanis]KTD17524.1 purine NTPase [Legionella jordanis]RMX05138.1 hypothetical protein EAW55_00280 [Legionella jordanis]RMX17394.1 hypothetical protein EAS68_10910 [Legionella jordanis]VEH13493.1 purine NTPase, putative [Legionella jordanis]